MKDRVALGIMAGALSIIVLLGVLLRSAYKKTGSLEAAITKQVEETEKCVDANVSNVYVVNDLKKQMKKMVDERRLDGEKREAILTQRSRELEEASAVANSLKTGRESEIKNKPDCADFASLDISMYCPINARQLRERSESKGSNANKDGG